MDLGIFPCLGGSSPGYLVADLNGLPLPRVPTWFPPHGGPPMADRESIAAIVLAAARNTARQPTFLHLLPSKLLTN